MSVADWALQAQDLSFSYPGAAPVFQHVSLGVRKREIVCLLGGSGCGKSSLLRVLAGFAQQYTGAIAIPHALPALDRD